ncbi:MAG: hypothetical protein ACYSWU_22715 [Planctomycetota bacterium]
MRKTTVTDNTKFLYDHNGLLREIDAGTDQTAGGTRTHRQIRETQE